MFIHYYSYYLLSNQDLLEKAASEKRLERREQRSWQSRKTRVPAEGTVRATAQKPMFVGKMAKGQMWNLWGREKQEMRSERNKSESKTAYGLVNHDKRSLAEWNERPTEGFKQSNNVIWQISKGWNLAGMWNTGTGWQAGDQLGGTAIIQHKKWQAQREAGFWAPRSCHWLTQED